MIRTAITAAVLAGMVAPTAPSAQTTADGARTVHVRYTDLDLSQPDDMKLLQHRIAMAVNTVCPFPVAGSMGDMAANSRCRAHAIRGAKQQLAALIATRAYAQADTKSARVQP